MNPILRTRFLLPFLVSAQLLPIPAAAQETPKRLNNFVTELVHVEPFPLAASTSIAFTNPRDGWVHIAVALPCANGTLTIELAGAPNLQLDPESTSGETVRKVERVSSTTV